MGCKEDPRCLSARPYPCLNCSATYLPCGGDCKPFSIQKRSATNLEGNKKLLNCCTYCIKTRSCDKVENEYLKNTRYNDPHYLKTGTGCVVNIENKYLKDEKDKRENFKQACVDYKRATKAQKQLEKEALIEKEGMVNKAKMRREMKIKKARQKAKDKKEKEVLKDTLDKEKKKEMKELKVKKLKKKKDDIIDKKEMRDMKDQLKQEQQEDMKETKKRKYEEGTVNILT